MNFAHGDSSTDLFIQQPLSAFPGPGPIVGAGK